MNSPYYDYQRFDFAGGLPRNVIGALSTQDAEQLQGKVIKQVIDDTIYDTAYFKAGTAVSTTALTMFSKQVSATDYVANDSTISFTKTPAQTNMTQPGTLQRGEMFIAESMQVLCTIPGTLDFSLQTTGNTTLPNATGTSAQADPTHASINMGALHTAICKEGVIRLGIGSNKELEGGPIYQWPSEFGSSGFGGAAQTGAAKTGDVVINDGVINNGFGFAREFRTGPRLIVNGTTIQVLLNFYNAFIPSRNFDIQVILKGFRLRDVG